MLSLTSPDRTPWHRLPAGAKLGALAILVPALFFVRDSAAMAAALLAVALAYATGGRAFVRAGLAALRPLWFFVAVLLLWHGIAADLPTGARLAARLVAAVALANLVTMTTPLDDIRGLLDRLAAPATRLGLPSGAAGLSAALVIRFVPVLGGHARALALAWRARSTRRPGWRLVLPLALAALDEAEHVAEALKARGGVARHRETD